MHAFLGSGATAGASTIPIALIELRIWANFLLLRNALLEYLQRNQLIERDGDGLAFKAEPDTVIRAGVPCLVCWVRTSQSSLSPAIRMASARGIVSSASARSKVRNPSSPPSKSLDGLDDEQQPGLRESDSV